MSLSGNTEKINALISKINALPEAGSGGGSGGASIETCTVKIDLGHMNMYPYYYSYMTVDNAGSLLAEAKQGSKSPNSITVTNVVCGSVFTVYWNDLGPIELTKATALLSSGNKYFNAYTITANAGETAIILNNMPDERG